MTIDSAQRLLWSIVSLLESVVPNQTMETPSNLLLTTLLPLCVNYNASFLHTACTSLLERTVGQAKLSTLLDLHQLASIENFFVYLNSAKTSIDVVEPVILECVKVLSSIKNSSPRNHNLVLYYTGKQLEGSQINITPLPRGNKTQQSLET